MVLDREALEGSPLSDLHLIADELGIDGFRRLRKAELIDRILAEGGETAGAQEQAGEKPEEAGEKPEEADEGEEAGKGEEGGEEEEEEEADGDGQARASRGRRRRGGRGRGRRGGEKEPEKAEEEGERAIDGVLELVANGSGFVRVSPPEPSEEDAYVSPGQVRRCELVSGDRVAGPVRPPRRSERYPSLVRVETINGRPADEVARGTRYEDLPAAYPGERIALGSDDPTLKAIEWLTPFGKGSRVTIAGGSRAGKTETLLRLAAALAAQDTLTVSVALAGVRPEEVALWREGAASVEHAASLASSQEAQAQAIDAAVEQAQRVASRGGDAVVLIDTLDATTPGAARRALAAARNIADGGSLTVIATAVQPLGGETTVIALDPALAQAGRLPAIDLLASGVVRPDLLVGEAGAQEIAKARAERLGV